MRVSFLSQYRGMRSGGTVTLMLMGDLCTRGCRFCNVKTGTPKGWLDEQEPEKVAFTLARLNLNYVVLTSVNRDDLEDEGSEHFAKTVSLLKKRLSHLLIEVLTPDFSGREELLQKIVLAKPDVFAHNLETVESLSPKVRDPRANYQQSLTVLEFVKKTKSLSLYQILPHAGFRGKGIRDFKQLKRFKVCRL